jgi:hypothetical protein
MPMPHSRRDSYGRPLPELTEARQELLLERPQNQAARRFLVALFEEQMAQSLRRGMHVDVVVRFQIQDGILQKDVDLTMTRHYRQTIEDGS